MTKKKLKHTSKKKSKPHSKKKRKFKAKAKATTKAKKTKAKVKAKAKVKSKTKAKTRRTKAKVKKQSFNPKKDPHYEREAELYEHPVPSREHILQCLQHLQGSANFDQLLKAFELSKSHRTAFKRRLRAMERDNQIVSDANTNFTLIDEVDLIKGVVKSQKDTSGILITEDKNKNIVLLARDMKKVLDGDVVLARVFLSSERHNRYEARVVEILERNTLSVVGKLVKQSKSYYVEPLKRSLRSRKILLEKPYRQDLSAHKGEFVVVEIIKQPSSQEKNPTGRVHEYLGSQLTTGLEIELAIRLHDLPFVWSDKAQQQAESFQSHVPAIETSSVSRKDLRAMAFVTIDGEDAQDFDDAVYCEPTHNGWRLFVAIADVAHYVTLGSALDECALMRGNSVYFPGHVVPMLPEILSNELCSLRPKQDRFALVCEMLLSDSGDVNEYKFYRAIIHSHARLTYTEVNNMLSGQQLQSTHVLKHVRDLHQLYIKLAEQRRQDGVIEFESEEPKIRIVNGKIADITPSHRNDAHRMIEEMMLLANMCAAKYLAKHQLPTLYRVHERPSVDKITALRDFLGTFGLTLSGGDQPGTQDFADLLQNVRQLPQSHLLETVMLRSMRQAFYSPENCGHFGLAYTHYVHFTSPIRRYPDLLVHRGIHYLLSQSKEPFPYDQQHMQQLGDYCSMTERRADRATRDATDWLKCDYMQNKLGCQYSGRIVDVVNFGLFVEIEGIFINGLIHVTALKRDYYDFDEANHLLRGRRTNRTYRLGDKVKIAVDKVDLIEGNIDFILVE